MSRDWTVWTWSSTAHVDGNDAAELWRLVHDESAPDAIVVLAEGLDGEVLGEVLVGMLDEPLAATASPIPMSDSSAHRIEMYELADCLPPPPTLGEPNALCVAFSVDILRSVWGEQPVEGITWMETLPSIARSISNRGWRHVGTPGLGLGRPSTLHRMHDESGWGEGTVSEIEGPANESLATHHLWARTRQSVRLVVDALCLDGHQHNGSQALVANIAEALAAARPSADVVLAVERGNVEGVRATAPASIGVIERGTSVVADVVYRPYQLLVPGELAWLTTSGERLVVGQLDMIGFSIPSYHPSPALFHMVRNLQRLTMRVADGVTFISEFGRRHALVECPDLERERCFVVSSGASAPTARLGDATSRRSFVLCLSAVFWHKHRDHAIRTFASMVADHGYAGDLLIAGPEPFHGRSSEAETALVATLPAEVRDRVHFLGQVDDTLRWELLAGADVLLYPSVVEGFGMVPFEAAAVGTASLVASGSALEEVFAGTGAVVESWDVRTWSGRAMALVDSPAIQDEMVRAVVECGERHTWARVAHETWNAIDEVLARPRARLHHDEGGWGARIAADGVISASAPTIHFANRLRAYGRRRLGRTGQR